VDYRARLRRMDELLGVGAFLRTPVRQLSLGERMRCELAAALLHAPALLILDEPTIGLDVAVKLRLRAFLAQLRDEGQTTIILTTHDLGDVAALCPRVLLLSGGKLLHDGSMAGLVRTLGGQRRVRVTLGAGGLPVELADFPGLISLSSSQVAVPVPPNTPDADILRKILALPGVADVVVEDDPLEALIARSYQS
jgi:ABC-2 type transport system ATP-binding protein